MWAWLLEECAGAFGATRRRGGVVFYLLPGALLLAGLGVMLVDRYHAASALLPFIALLFVGVGAAKNVLVARQDVWRGVCLGLADPRQRAVLSLDAPLLSPSARALQRLAIAIDAVRRGEPGRAAEVIPRIDRALLRPEEERLLDATRALVALELGDRALCAQLAVRALPTGSGELDARLGRAVVAEAWRSRSRLEAVDRAFRDQGLGLDLGKPLHRIAALVRLRVAPEEVSALPAGDARVLGDEARALGLDDDAFAAEIEGRTRARMYR